MSGCGTFLVSLRGGLSSRPSLVSRPHYASMDRGMLQLNTHRRKTPTFGPLSQSNRPFKNINRSNKTLFLLPLNQTTYKALFISETYVYRRKGETVRLLPEIVGDTAARDVVTCFIASGRAEVHFGPW